MTEKFADYVIEIEHQLRQIARTVRRQGRMLLESYGITPPQFDALIILNQAGDLTIGDLSTRLYLAYSTTTDLVDRLERANLVIRRRDLDDRRVVRVTLQQAGSAIYGEVLDARRAYLAKILDTLGDDERKGILGVLQMLDDRMSKR